MNDRWAKLIVPALVSMLTFCLGYILSAANLNGLRAEVRHLCNEDARIERMVEARFTQLSGMVEKLIVQNQQFIELLRVQNELLQRIYSR